MFAFENCHNFIKAKSKLSMLTANLVRRVSLSNLVNKYLLKATFFLLWEAIPLMT